MSTTDDHQHPARVPGPSANTLAGARRAGREAGVDMAGRRCPGKDDIDGRTRACPTILTGGERYCPRHARQYEQRRGSTTARGYNTQHRALRAHWQARIDAGETVMCADGCGVRITGRTWQLGHDHQHGGYLGPQTIACNTREGGRRGRATQT